MLYYDIYWGHGLRRKNMYLGKNIQYLRKQRKITQEGFSEQMAVSRQTVAKWEAGDAIPELGKLLEMCDFFSCKLDWSGNCRAKGSGLCSNYHTETV